MATQAFKVGELTLLNGKTLKIRSVPLKQLREVMDIIDTLDDVLKDEKSTSNAVLDLFAEAAKVCLRGLEGKALAEGEDWDDVLDQDTINEILKVCANVQMNNENLMAALEAQMIAQNGAS